MTEENWNRFLGEWEEISNQKTPLVSGKTGIWIISKKVTWIVAQIFWSKTTKWNQNNFVMPEDWIFWYGWEFDNRQDCDLDFILQDSDIYHRKWHKWVFLSEEELASLFEMGQEEAKILKTLIIEEISESLFDNPEVIYKNLFLGGKYDEAIKICIVMVEKINKEIEIIEWMKPQLDKYAKLIVALNSIKKTWENRWESATALFKRESETTILKN